MILPIRGRYNANMKAAHSARDEQTFYLYVSSLELPILTSESVFYRVAGKRSATQLCRLFRKEYSSESGSPVFFLKSSAEVDPDEQILLDEAMAWLDVYVDPDTGVYDPPPTEELMVRAEYKRRAHKWEAIIGMRTVSKIGSPIDEDSDQIPDTAGPEDSKPSSSSDKLKRVRRRKKRALTSRADTSRNKSGARRLTATIQSPTAARQMEAYLESKGIGQTEFANQVGTTDRTLRTFRKTGKVRRDIFKAIAKAMGTTKEALLTAT